MENESAQTAQRKGRGPLRNLLLAGGALIALAILFSSITRPPIPVALIGEPAPSVSLPLVGGGTFDIAKHAGDIVILDFWATWCQPCRVSMPIVDRVAQDYADRGVHLYFINEGEDPEMVGGFASHAALHAPVALDRHRTLGNAFQVQGIPFTVIVGRDGTVENIRIGSSMQIEGELRADLDKTLALDSSAPGNEL